MSFTARYHGECAGGDHISPGDLVQYDADHELYHEDCADVLSERDAICPHCNTIHAGDCL